MRAFVAFLLVITVVIAAAAHPSRGRRNPPVMPDDEQQLTPEEEREARALVERFSEGWRKTNDIATLMDEMFVRDFPHSERRVTTEGLPYAFLNKALVVNVSDEDLRRYYVASINFYYLYFRINDLIRSARGQSENNEESISAADILSPEIINVLLGDPIIAGLVNESKGEEEHERTEEAGSRAEDGASSEKTAQPTAEAETAGAEEEDDIGVVKTAAQLKSVSTTLEKADELMRKRLASLPPGPPEKKNDDAAEDRRNSPDIHLKILEEGDYGYLESRRAICVHVESFYMYLVRSGGRLKILSVALYID